MINMFLNLERWLELKFGYNFVIHFEDFCLFTAGVFIGAMLFAIFSGDTLSKTEKVRQRRLDKLKMVDVKGGKKTKYIFNVNSVSECIEALLIILIKPFFTIKKYTLKDEKRTKRFIIIFFIIGAILIILAFNSIFTVYTPITK